MWTAEQLEQARAKEQRDRKKLKKMIAIAVVMAAGAASFVLADFAYTPIVFVSGTIVERWDAWTLRQGSKCIISLETGLGLATWTEWRECKSVRWRLGQVFSALRVRRGRITGWLQVYKGLHN